MLYVCATPIGNLEDITLRVLRVLREVDAVVAEDTRQTRKLLQHYEIEKRLLSYHSHNWRVRLPRLLAELRQGRSFALLTDAGSPGISDPGRELVAACRLEGLPVTGLPGPSAAVTAVMITGLLADRWCFEGFLPRSGGARRERLQQLASEERAIVIFESPHRLVRTLQDLAELLPDRRAAVARELTKVYEEIDTGTVADLATRWAGREVKGEITLVLEAQALPGWMESSESGAEAGAGAGADAEAEDLEGSVELAGKATVTGEQQMRLQLRARVEAVMESGTPRKEALRLVAKEHGLSRRQLYQLLYVAAEDD